MNLLITLLQDVDINEKLKDAPDSSYGIGVFIGTLLPFVLLVAIAYAVYRYNKNRFKEE
ncbi:hypothetical protein DFQ11_101821 [Winogradskyella epiphytica]|uniref:Uncharacterized protein n=1 Tax=Winogradskyella epiphytica TaxID=262005 RepID=A0A2V4XX60_9FLAO|nr:hypothetical protein [Winogradskyella epiphytica]PYE83387.1 hypothetical protein DFQ11_101821 [Winogradskyella epiphytica]GGW57798.1 hypothetical protein GCM10008085_06800 [Winogradskyella epiphytica]